MNKVISPKTVLILGAGASHDCGFPLGIKLIDQIITAHQDKKFVLSLRRILYNARDYLRRNNLFDLLPPEIGVVLLSHQPYRIFDLNDKILTDWVVTLNVFKSIDEFISYHKKYSLLAKISILLILSKCELKEFFDNRHQNDQVKSYFGPERTWYNALWGNITKKGPTFQQLEEILKTIHIITFNYDRSLEFFLVEAIKKFFPESEKPYTDLPITHVYGSLGQLDTQSDLFNPYQQVPYMSGSTIPDGFQMNTFSTYLGEKQEDAMRTKYDEHLIKLATSIETYGNAYPIDKAEKIQQMIIESKNTYVFGFSFAEQNMKILFKGTPKRQPQWISKGTFDGSCYGISREMQFDLKTFSSKYFKGTSDFLDDSRRKVSVADFFTDYSIKI